MLDNYAPRTMMLLGAALSGGDVMALAKRISENDLTPADSEVVLNSEGNATQSENNDEVERSSGTG